MTYTVVALPVSRAAYDEIAELLRAAGYDVFINPPQDIEGHKPQGRAINMDGIALITEEPPAAKKFDPLNDYPEHGDGP
jgi:hypothetical protein